MKKIMLKIKNNIHYIWKSLLCLSIILSVFALPVNAASYNLTEEFATGWTLHGDAYGTGTIIRVNGEEVFCLEGDKGAYIGVNSEILPSDIGLTQIQINRLALVAWYGYRSQPNLTNYMLTQNLIWKELGDNSYATSSEYPSLTSMQPWFDSILNKVNRFNDRPSFHGKQYTVNLGDTLSITDTNGVLSGLNINSVSNTTITKNGNTLNITPTFVSADNLVIRFNRGLSMSQTQTNFIVRNGNSQACSRLTGQDPYNSYVRVKVNKVGNLEITKINEIGELLDGAVFNLKSITPGINYNQDIVVKDGRIKVENLIIGDYILTEVTAPDHHVITTSYQVTIKPNETTERIVVNRIKPTGKLVINKSFEEVSDIKDVDLSNVRFEVIAKRDVYDLITLQKVYSAGEIVSTLSLDETGQSILEDIPMGEYVVKEISTLPEYILDTKEYDVVFRQEDYVTKEYIRTLNLENKLLLTDIQVKKVDAQTKRTIVSKDFQFGLYSDEACTNLISTMNADRKTGTATFKDIRFGTYYIKEISAPRGYMLSDEIIKVVVDENLENVGKTYTIEYQNTMMPIIVNTGDNTIDSSVFMILAVFSFIVVMLIKKRSFQKMDDAKKEIDTDEFKHYKKE